MYKIIKLALITLLMLFLLTGCEIEPTQVEVTNLTDNWNSSLDLVADENTGIIYYYYNGTGNQGDSLCPYYSENGKLCRFEDGKIVEIGE